MPYPARAFSPSQVSLIFYILIYRLHESTQTEIFIVFGFLIILVTFESHVYAFNNLHVRVRVRVCVRFLIILFYLLINKLIFITSEGRRLPSLNYVLYNVQLYYLTRVIS